MEITCGNCTTNWRTPIKHPTTQAVRECYERHYHWEAQAAWEAAHPACSICDGRHGPRCPIEEGPDDGFAAWEASRVF
jgi:hypothetical protein